MTLKADLATEAVAALQDIRCAAIRLLLEDILVRRTHGGGIPQYRVYLKGTDTPVQDFASLLTHFTESSILVTYDSLPGNSSFQDKTKPVTLIVTDLEVRFLNRLDEDAFFTERFGRDATTITVTLNYLADADTALPLKAIDAAVISSSVYG